MAPMPAAQIGSTAKAKSHRPGQEHHQVLHGVLVRAHVADILFRPVVGRRRHLEAAAGHARLEQGEVVHQQRHAAENARIDVIAHGGLRFLMVGLGYTRLAEPMRYDFAFHPRERRRQPP